MEPNINQSNELEEDISIIEKDSQPRERESEELLPIPNNASNPVFKIIYQINVQIDGNENATKKLGKSLHEIININDMLEKTLDKVTEVEFNIREVLDSGDFKPEDLRDTMKRIDILVTELRTMGKTYARNRSKGQQYSGLVKPSTIKGKPGKGTELSVKKSQVKSKDKLHPATLIEPITISEKLSNITSVVFDNTTKGGNDKMQESAQGTDIEPVTSTGKPVKGKDFPEAFPCGFT